MYAEIKVIPPTKELPGNIEVEVKNIRADGGKEWP